MISTLSTYSEVVIQSSTFLDNKPIYLNYPKRPLDKTMKATIRD
jgi:hypothetical protein